jgi:hypothetical protein
MERWSDGAMERWSDGAMERWSDGNPRSNQRAQELADLLLGIAQNRLSVAEQ